MPFVELEKTSIGSGMEGLYLSVSPTYCGLSGTEAKKLLEYVRIQIDTEKKLIALIPNSDKKGWKVICGPGKNISCSKMLSKYMLGRLELKFDARDIWVGSYKNLVPKVGTP